MEQPEKRRERGLKTLRHLSNEAKPTVIASLADITPDLNRFIAKFAYRNVLTQPELDLRNRELVTIGALAALSNAAPQLRFHINGALNAGCTRAEVIEALIQIAVYAGFPATINAVEAAREVF